VCLLSSFLYPGKYREKKGEGINTRAFLRSHSQQKERWE